MDLSIILINYNTANYSLNCVESLLKNSNSKLSFEIIVIDNNSSNEDFLVLSEGLKKTPQVSLYKSSVNTGFGGGNMIGVQYAKGKYLLFINNDVLLKNNALILAFNLMESSNDIGVCTAQNFDENNNFVPSFDHDKGLRKLMFGRGFLENFYPKKYPKRNKKYLSPVAVNFVNGAFMFFRKKYFEQVGGFDPNIFLFYEEMDICYRMRKIGYKCVLLPNAEIIHFQGASTGNSKILQKEGLVSYLYVLRKNYSFIKYMSILIYYLITFLIKPKKWNLLPIVIKGAQSSSFLRS